MNRRQFITSAVAAIGGSLAAIDPARSGEPRTGPAARARVAITFDLEMSRNFPRPEDTHWDCQKGNLDDATKAYAVKSARIVKEHGGLMHFFLLGSTLEQDNVDWLYELIAGGHRIGNHTYDHINLKAMRIEELQPRFTRAPWLVAGRPLGAVIEDNIRKTS